MNSLTLPGTLASSCDVGVSARFHRREGRELGIYNSCSLLEGLPGAGLSLLHSLGSCLVTLSPGLVMTPCPCNKSWSIALSLCFPSDTLPILCRSPLLNSPITQFEHAGFCIFSVKTQICHQRKLLIRFLES